MILQHFKKKENEYKRIADKTYLEILNKSKQLMNKNYFKEISFDSSFEIITLILVFYLKILKDLDGSKYKNINDELIKNFINDLDKSFRDIGIGDMSIGKYVKKYVKKFYFRVKKIDLILVNFDHAKLINYLNSIKYFDKKTLPNLAADLMNIHDEIRNNTKN